MQAITSLNRPRNNVPLKSIALPIEHGSWGFVFEPLTAGLLLAPSLAAPFFAILIIGAFLTRQPLKFLLADWQQGRRLPRTEIALRFVLIFGAVALLGLAGSLVFAPAVSFIPLVVVTPAVIYLILQDAARQTRNLAPELIAAVALSSSPAVLALAAGWSWPLALSVWAIMASRLIPSIVYVRNRLRMEKGKEFSKFGPMASHILALLVVTALAFAGLAPFLMIPVMAFLLVRAATGLSRFRQKVRAKIVGIWEIVYGVITVLALVLGFYFGL
jgi:hypothetical protein